MKSNIGKDIPAHIDSVDSLGKLFNKKFTTNEYCNILKNFLKNQGQMKDKQSTHNRNFTTRKIVNYQRNSLKRTSRLNRKSRMRLTHKPNEISESNIIEPKSQQKSFTARQSRPLGQFNSIRQSCLTKVTPKIKEDRSFVCYSKKGRLLFPNKHSIVDDKNIFILCEGNGDKGQEVSAFISEFLLKSIKYLFSLEEHKNMKQEELDRLNEYFQQMFSSANYQLTLTDIDIRRSGCTTIIVYIYKQTMMVVSAGKANAILVGKNDSQIIVQQKQKSLLHSMHSMKSLKKIKTPTPALTKRPKKQNNCQIFNGFGNIYYDNCICVPLINIIKPNRYEYVLIGSESVFSQMSEGEIVAYLMQNQNHKLAYRAKDMVDTICKRLKTISHQDVSCIILKISK